MKIINNFIHKHSTHKKFEHSITITNVNTMTTAYMIYISQNKQIEHSITITNVNTMTTAYMIYISQNKQIEHSITITNVNTMTTAYMIYISQDKQIKQITKQQQYLQLQSKIMQAVCLQLHIHLNIFYPKCTCNTKVMKFEYLEILSKKILFTKKIANISLKQLQKALQYKVLCKHFICKKNSQQQSQRYNSCQNHYNINKFQP
eukprot:TRINITY_DN2326_c0_g1_i8.p1 TRINITY_DN2326_c0_g1~~TRINITY_DN2326_c0_g1_i8.p1  ORF type:complete len:204 (+),score=-17.10 TRINITY_DN2326_c0_g1_i8:604-1215(+)